MQATLSWAGPNFFWRKITNTFRLFLTSVQRQYNQNCPVVDYNGEPTILDVEAVEFIAGPTAGLNYIAANYPKADQERVKA
mgnify:CR=1 FL=1